MKIHGEDFLNQLYLWQLNPELVSAEELNTIEVHLGSGCEICEQSLIENARFIGIIIRAGEASRPAPPIAGRIGPA